jgi:hypothetical protein
MIDIRYFLARQKNAQDAAAEPPSSKKLPCAQTRQVIPAWAGLTYSGPPDEPLPDKPAFDLTKQKYLEGCEP